jgi:hypothetical protein
MKPAIRLSLAMRLRMSGDLPPQLTTVSCLGSRTNLMQLKETYDHGTCVGGSRVRKKLATLDDQSAELEMVEL